MVPPLPHFSTAARIAGASSLPSPLAVTVHWRDHAKVWLAVPIARQRNAVTMKDERILEELQLGGERLPTYG
jgi:hypothetical protein